ncbi:MAG: hypothetical protein PHR87_05600 [Sulfurospirillaceae bacterium]|nr:hypothetical protein [Sulfurospirillaceae bacterium]
MSWIDNFQIAIIEENYEQIGKLIQDVPTFTDIETAQYVLALVQEAIILVDNEKAKTAKIMQMIKQTKEFLLSSSENQHYNSSF